MKLGVNIDHIATLRQARKGVEPDPVHAAVLCELGGADGITVHLRGDRRHIQDRDVEVLKRTVATRLNIELAATSEMVEIAAGIQPWQVTLVPERREEVTTEGGLDVVLNAAHLTQTVSRLASHNIRVSLFVDPFLENIRSAHKVGAHAIEINTNAYATARTEGDRSKALRAVDEAARLGDKLGLGVLAGHALTYRNVGPIVEIKAHRRAQHWPRHRGQGRLRGARARGGRNEGAHPVTPVPEGIQAAPSLLVTAGRGGPGPVVTASPARRAPPAQVHRGEPVFPLGIAIGWGLLASTSYPLALLVAFALFAFAMLVHAFVPRLAMAVACSWIFLAVYGAHLFFTGSFGFSRPLAFGLFPGGRDLWRGFSTLRPRRTRPGPWPGSCSSPPFPSRPASGGPCWWRWGVPLPGLGPALHAPPACHPAGPPPPSLADKRRAWTGALGWGTSVLTLLIFCVTLLAPTGDPTSLPIQTALRLSARGAP